MASVCLICLQVWEIWVRIHSTPSTVWHSFRLSCPVRQSVGSKFNLRSPQLQPEFQTDSFDSHTPLMQLSGVCDLQECLKFRVVRCWEKQRSVTVESGPLVFLFLMFWCIGLKVCNTFSLVIRTFLAIIYGSALPIPVALLVVLRQTKSGESWEFISQIAKSYRIIINKAWKASGSSFGNIFDV